MASPWDLIIATLSGVLGGGIVATVATEGIRWWKRPILKLDVGVGRPWAADRAVTEPPFGHSRLRRYIRGRVRNLGRTTASGCRAYVVRFSPPGESRNLLDNPVLLSWAADDGLQPSLQPKIDLFVNIAFGEEGTSWPFPAVGAAPDAQFSDLFKQHADLGGRGPRLGLVVVADGAGRAELDVEYVWRGRWDTIEWKV